MLAVAVLVVSVRLYRLSNAPADFYGDTAIVIDYVREVLAGQWPLHFTLSAGPLDHYLIAPIVWLGGMNYLALKLASAIVSLAVLVTVFHWARLLVDDEFALLTTAVAGTSSWLLIFSRLGNSQIVLPLVSTAALIAAMLVARRPSLVRVAACATISALGLYAYPQTFILPLVVGVVLAGLRWSDAAIRKRRGLALFAVVTLLCAVPFAFAAPVDTRHPFSGYVGGKFVSEGSPISAFLRNTRSALLAFHVKGDAVFRSNPRSEPHLDPISGALFLAGVGFWITRAGAQRRTALVVIAVPFVLLQIPSILVLRYPNEVPSASRTLAAAPIVYLLVASGLWWAQQRLARAAGLPLARLAAWTVVALIVALNLSRYFVDYLEGLPYHNTSIGAELETFAEQQPITTQIDVVDCCWESEMPNVYFIGKVARHPERFHVVDGQTATCATVQNLQRPAVLVWSFKHELPAPSLGSCQALPAPTLYRSSTGRPLFHAATLPAVATAGR